jgi:hypothetical protein
MTDLHDAGDTRYRPQIDSVGWVFAGVVVIITAIAGIVAYHSSDTMVATGPVGAHRDITLSSSALFGCQLGFSAFGGPPFALSAGNYLPNRADGRAPDVRRARLKQRAKPPAMRKPTALPSAHACWSWGVEPAVGRVLPPAGPTKKAYNFAR